MNPRKVFITGGTGYIGMAFVQLAREAGLIVQVLTRSDKGAQRLRAQDITPVIGDLTQSGEWQTTAGASDLIVHLAQPETYGAKITHRRAEDYREQRLRMDKLLLDSLKPETVNRIVYVGGTSYYGNQGLDLKDETTRPNPKGWGPYIAPAIEMLPSYVERGLPIVQAFPTWVYGPASWFAEYQLTPLYTGKPVFGLRGHNHFSSPVHVEDCARAILFLLDNGEAGERYFVADDLPVHASELVACAARALNTKPKVRAIPEFMAQFVLGPVITESLKCDVRLSNAKLKSLGFKLNFPTIEQGVPDVVRHWLIKQQPSAIAKQTPAA